MSGNGSSPVLETLVIGAGMSGLVAARVLHEEGRAVLVLDKGRGFGGRMAARQFGGARFEHGAHFLEARSADFKTMLEEWAAAGVVAPWYEPDPSPARGSFRYRGKPDMNALAAHLAEGLQVRRSQRVTAIRKANAGWEAVCEGQERFRARQVLLTCPVPQALDLLAAGGVSLDPADHEKLSAVTYESCLTVMAVLTGPSRIASPGLAVPEDPRLDRICDHQVQGSSAEPAVTIQTGHDFSAAGWERPRDDTAREILDAAAPYLGSAVQEYQIHGWRYCRPILGVAESALELKNNPGLFLAGDAFGGKDLEGAALSGKAAARLLLTPP